MKLRLNGQSVRLRVLRSEVAELVASGRVEEKTFLAPGHQPCFTYALETNCSVAGMQMRHDSSGIVILIPSRQAQSWAGTDQVGLYATVDLGPHGTLDLIVEKDFACLDLSDAENKDTFSNPLMGATC